ncbi:hypothetical protein RHMOL_Rhmol13G0166100 [Rhododendron molle]|uniref:Uncharacterized protein n=1 Tax=Rhododendron molle TaxID=49168 RepID=A0ACC0L827_RHOML|nr:hypothetical protein RHMOL_Rhmol13G0166100 [Rhododendron molle]
MNPRTKNTSMADHGGNGGTGEVLNRPKGQTKDRGEPMAVEPEDQTAAEPVGVDGAVVQGGGDGEQSGEQEGAGGEETRSVEAEPCAMDRTGAVGPRIDPTGPLSMVEGLPEIGGSGDVDGSSSASGGDTGPSGSPPRDSAKGKGIVVEEEQTAKDATVEIREENIAFRPPVTAATSSRHVAITLDDVAEHTPDEILAKLLEDNPIIGEYVLKAKEDRARAIEASEAAARAERERAGGGCRDRGKRSRGGSGAESECSD